LNYFVCFRDITTFGEGPENANGKKARITNTVAERGLLKGVAAFVGFGLAAGIPQGFGNQF
jgi:hypothetical protein